MGDWKVRLSTFERLALGLTFVGGVIYASVTAWILSDPMIMAGLIPMLVIYSLPWPANHPDGRPGSFTAFDCFTQQN